MGENEYTDQYGLRFTLIRSSRKTISVTVLGDETVQVRAPERLPLREVRGFVESRHGWICRQIQSAAERRERFSGVRITPEVIRQLRAGAERDLPPRVAYWARKAGLIPGGITVRCQKTLWGSCSSNKNLSFNCLLMLCPEKVRDYVVVHELCHLKHMDHSDAFWKDVERLFPAYTECRRWLDEEGTGLIHAVREAPEGAKEG